MDMSCNNGCYNCSNTTTEQPKYKEQPQCKEQLQCKEPPKQNAQADQYRIQQNNVCSPRNCILFGEHDNNPMSYVPLRRSKFVSRRGDPLGSPVGIVCASNAKQAEFGAASTDHIYAVCLKVFANIFIMNEEEWTTEVVDELLSQGTALANESAKNEEEENEEDAPNKAVYNELEASIKHAFDLRGCSFKVELGETYALGAGGQEMRSDNNEPLPDVSMEDFKYLMEHFFRDTRYGLLRIGTWYVVIWRARFVWFIFDSNGRRLTDFITDKEKGKQMLICLPSLDNVVHLVLRMSGFGMTNSFSLREMKIARLKTLDGRTMYRDFGKRVNQWEVRSDDYAILRSKLHLALTKGDIFRYRAALPVAVAAILASKIDHPATWHQKMMHNILCYGASICKECMKKCVGGGTEINVQDFPTELKIGQFVATFKLETHMEGKWKCVPKWQGSEMARYISESFDQGANYLIFQLGFQYYAIWKKNYFIYLFDPYRHRVEEPKPKPDADSEAPDTSKSASLRMFRTLASCLFVFNLMLLEHNKTSRFILHKVVLQRLCLAEHPDTKDQEDALEKDSEVVSLNETLCFEEDAGWCAEALTPISDYEVEEEPPDLLDEYQEESTPELEIMGEEEGGKEANAADEEAEEQSD